MCLFYMSPRERPRIRPPAITGRIAITPADLPAGRPLASGTSAAAAAAAQVSERTNSIHRSDPRRRRRRHNNGSRAAR